MWTACPLILHWLWSLVIVIFMPYFGSLSWEDVIISRCVHVAPGWVLAVMLSASVFVALLSNFDPLLLLHIPLRIFHFLFLPKRAVIFPLRTHNKLLCRFSLVYRLTENIWVVIPGSILLVWPSVWKLLEVLSKLASEGICVTKQDSLLLILWKIFWNWLN